MLSKLGVNAEVVASGHEALQALAALPYDLVFMDVQMPVMNGLEATRQLRSGADPHLLACRDIPVIALTAYALVKDREKCLAAGMSDYITKPLARKDLMRILNKWLPQGSDVAVGDAAPATEPGTRNLQQCPVYDRAAFLDRFGGDETIMHTVEKSFLAVLPTQIAELKSHVAQGDLEETKRLTHTIKSVAGNLSAEALRETIIRMEVAAKAGEVARLQGMLPELAKQVRRLKAEMRKPKAESRSPRQPG